MIHLEACRDHASAHETVGMVLRMVFARHGCPRVILSDRGTQFNSELWRELWKMMGTRVAMASTHHPQSNGLTERCNRTLISLVRKYAHSYPRHWAEFLPMFEFAYNSAVHSVTNVAPFIAEKGYYPPIPASLLTTEWTVTSPDAPHMNQYVRRIKAVVQHVRTIIKTNEAKASRIIAQRENTKRGNIVYQSNDEVLVYWPPFRAYADVARKHRLRYIGPFKVVRAVGANAVELEGLPPTNAMRD